MNIRTAVKDDWHELIKIYNHAVDEKYCTADTKYVTLEDKSDWPKLHSENSYPIFVIEENGKIVGWCSLSPYRAGRQALRSVAEISYYVHKDYREKGLANTLISYALDKSTELEFKNLIAILLELNKTSIYLLEKFGFAQWGYLPNIARFDDVTCGQFIFGRSL